MNAADGKQSPTDFNIFVRQSLRQGKIPFELSIASDPFYSTANMAVLRRSIGEATVMRIISARKVG